MDKIALRKNKKYKWILSLIGGAVVSISILSCAKVRTEIIIPASPDVIWAVLMNASGYKEWNPVIIPFEGDLREGQKLRYWMIQPNGKESIINAKVAKITSKQLLNQRGGIPGILTFDHQWLLEPVEGGTKVIQHEEYRGIGVWFWDYSWVEPAYKRANEALRDKVTRQ